MKKQAILPVKSEIDLEVTAGIPYPFGTSDYQGGVNFAVYAKEAEKLSLCLFLENNTLTPFKEIELDPALHKTGDVWHVLIRNLPPFTVYAYRVTPIGSADAHLLLDPYAKAVVSHTSWGGRPGVKEIYRPLGKMTLTSSPFDWEGVKHPRLPFKDLILYEMHVRGFTRDESSAVQHPGTFLGIIEKIPYLKELGVNALELMPVYEFNETEVMQQNPKTKQKLVNYFGYSTVNFFSPMNRYASEMNQDKAILEFKTMVKELHRNGIEVILDVVYNHTFEGNEMGPTLTFRGFDRSAYYMMEGDNYLNFSGCGNTINSNHPTVIEFIIASLRYWVTEMHVDGFRFDLASIMSRAENGAPLNNAPLIEAISRDPILSETKLIAEAWDAGGLYQVGGFYHTSRWAEWNGRYRDVVRRFIKGTSDHKTAFATALSGSQDMYGWRGTPCCSINFITAHDGFSLADLVTYNEKHNLENGEENRDGFDHNDSWNCGIEGHSSNKKIVYLRERQIRNFFLALMVSQGIPMILMGDEYAHTRNGNNNTWCQDNELNWFLWNNLENRPGFSRFFRSLIAFRKGYSLLGRDTFLDDSSVSWHGTTPLHPEWENDNRFVAFSLNIPDQGPDLYVAFNASHTPLMVTIPQPAEGKHWVCVVNTHNPPPEDYYEEGYRKRVISTSIRIPSYTSIMLQAVAEP
ncbi:Glycogen debranching enzyme [Candidatus Protochlamydia naegleriophila]|uniref:Glycogen debranching enzyme n=1 Tax=Candidatus Protochlamydia naegleriophila TaxID=389348 RepID=A0A0U5JAE0_9BACT|nr:isoamylase [Candidatus Protochlamydia naegleriophila]CUI16398.1 Glycogen debranching enzyme [Candidatus Protochlamydia naegleriophila]